MDDEVKTKLTTTILDSEFNEWYVYLPEKPLPKIHICPYCNKATIRTAGICGDCINKINIIAQESEK